MDLSNQKQNDTTLVDNVNIDTHKKYTALCSIIIDETPDVRTFYFTVEKHLGFTFKPGQFINLELPINGEIILRPYSISSSPSTPDTFSITVKKIPNGEATQWLWQHMVVGSAIHFSSPADLFNYLVSPEKYLSN